MAQGSQHQHEEKQAKLTRYRSDLTELRGDVERGNLSPVDEEERDELVALIDRLLA